MILELIVVLLVVSLGVLISTKKGLVSLPLPEQDMTLYEDLEQNRLFSEPDYMPMTFFSRNKISPACCPSYYSTSGGCICMTPEQATVLSDRG